MNKSRTVLQEAEELINGDRKEAYREAKTSFDKIAAGFSYYDCACVHVFMRVGTRFPVDYSEKAEHLGKIMLSDYNIYLGK